MYTKQDKDRCMCTDAHYIVTERKTLSHIVALSLLIGFFVFVSGYFLGKRVATQEFLNQFEQESFADRISHSLHTQYSPHAAVLDNARQSDSESGETKVVENKAAVPAESCDVKNEQTMAAVQANSPAQKEQAVISGNLQSKTNTSEATYYAQLFGGTQEAARRCIDQLAQRGITTRMVKKSSKTARANVVYWYQVETERFADKSELEKLVATVKKIAKLHDVNIIKG